MRIYSPDGATLDVQPFRVARYLAAGWSKEPPAPAETTPDLDSMKRAELDAYAAKVGVEDPDQLPNIAAVRDAIRAAADTA